MLENRSVNVFLNSNLVDIQHSNDRLTGVKVTSYTGNNAIINAKKFVFAMGGIENCETLDVISFHIVSFQIERHLIFSDRCSEPPPLTRWSHNDCASQQTHTNKEGDMTTLRIARATWPTGIVTQTRCKETQFVTVSRLLTQMPMRTVRLQRATSH